MKPNSFPLTKYNQAAFIFEGDDYYKRYLDLIKNAKSVIHIQTYIFMLDSFGKAVYRELINAVHRNVEVYVLVDSVGSRLFDAKEELKLINEGIHFHRFNHFQLKWIYSWGRRLHHKILLIDNEIGLIGGINISSSSMLTTSEAKLDFALQLQGPIIIQIKNYCETIFNKSVSKPVNFTKMTYLKNITTGIDIKLLVNDWVKHRRQITVQYSNFIKNAKNKITIVHSYFFPRKSFIKQLITAKKRGVIVQLVLPKYSDWPSYVLASEYLYSQFLKNNIEIYLWKKSIHHGKLAIIDNQIVTIGSFNINYTSYQQNLELNAMIDSQDFAQEVSFEIDQRVINECEKIDVDHFINDSSFGLKIKRLFFYIILATIANFSIGLIYQEEYKKKNKIKSLARIIGTILFFILGSAGLLFAIKSGLIFIVLSLSLFYQQIMFNKKKEMV